MLFCKAVLASYVNMTEVKRTKTGLQSSLMLHKHFINVFSDTCLGLFTMLCRSMSSYFTSNHHVLRTLIVLMDVEW